MQSFMSAGHSDPFIGVEVFDGILKKQGIVAIAVPVCARICCRSVSQQTSD